MLRLLLSLSWLTVGVMGLQRLVYVQQSLNWTGAQAYCKKYYTDLVTVTTEEENNQLNQETWIGLRWYDSSSDWKWSNGDQYLVSTFTSTWPNSSPGNGEKCACKLKDTRSWTRTACSQPRSFFCTNDNLFLKIVKNTWEEALVHCRALSTRNHIYDLASLITAEDHEYTRSRISGQVWIGLRFVAGYWVWAGGEEVEFEDLDSCPKDELCGMIDKSNPQNYTVTRCDEKRDFFCYRKPIII